MIGLTEPGWLRRIGTSEMRMPSERTRAGAPSCGLTTITTDGAGVARTS